MHGSTVAAVSECQSPFWAKNVARRARPSDTSIPQSFAVNHCELPGLTKLYLAGVRKLTRRKARAMLKNSAVRAEMTKSSLNGTAPHGTKQIRKEQIATMLDRYCVIGDPIAHSMSPAIYSILFDRYDIPAKYTAVRVPAGELPAFIADIPENGIRGFNVTMPLKTAVEPYLVYRDPGARFGVNTVCVRNDGLYGYSTDAQGFQVSLSIHGRTYKGSRVVFIGCGGAAHALIYDALQNGASHVSIVNRTPRRAADFEENPRVSILPWHGLAQACAECDLLINATPLGMHGVKDDFASLAFLQELPVGAFVADLVYNPQETRLLIEARRLGHEGMNGLGMLTWQGILAFEKYTGIMAPRPVGEEVCSALSAILSAR